jgi:hypothetical protein
MKWPARIARLRGPRMCVNLPVRASEVLSASLKCGSTPEVAHANSPSGRRELDGRLLTLSPCPRASEGASGCLTVLRSGEPLLQRCGKAGIERSHGVTYIGLAVGRATPICIRDGRFEIGTAR